MKRRIGFTLIELLIVVAIIAILAAIAVPNFLEAQVRAKVSRAKSDMRSLATAMEAFRIDNTKYPFGDFGTCALYPLTSPIAYITSLPKDPFMPNKAWHPYAPNYFTFTSSPELGTWATFVADFMVNTVKAPATDAGWAAAHDANSGIPARWQFRSLGPDKVGNWSAPYDSTNGTTSAGDISLFGPGNPGIF